MGLVASAFLFSGFLSVASLLLVLSLPCKGAQIHSPGARLWTSARALGAPSTFGEVPSPAPPSPGWPLLLPGAPASGRCIRAGRTRQRGQGFGRAQKHSTSRRPSLAGRAQGGPLPRTGVRTSSKGDGGLWGACAQAGRAGYPGDLGSTQRTRVPGPPGEVAFEKAGSEKTGLHCARSAPEQRGGAAAGLAGGGSRERGGGSRPLPPKAGLPRAPAAAAGGGPEGRGRGPARGGAAVESGAARTRAGAREAAGAGAARRAVRAPAGARRAPGLGPAGQSAPAPRPQTKALLAPGPPRSRALPWVSGSPLRLLSSPGCLLLSEFHGLPRSRRERKK